MAAMDLAGIRIGTWNLEGKWSIKHANLLTSFDCDLLLLTETRRDIELPGYQLAMTNADMQPGRAWASIASRIGLDPLPDPHPATAMAIAGNARVCSSILPWRNAAKYSAFTGASTTEMTTDAVQAISQAMPQVWGGDWNHSLKDREYVGSLGGRSAITHAVQQLGMQVPTSALAARTPGQLAIDHIAIPKGLSVTASVIPLTRSLSDHDAYIVEIGRADSAA